MTQMWVYDECVSVAAVHFDAIIFDNLVGNSMYMHGDYLYHYHDECSACYYLIYVLGDDGVADEHVIIIVMVG